MCSSLNKERILSWTSILGLCLLGFERAAPFYFGKYPWSVNINEHAADQSSFMVRPTAIKCLRMTPKTEVLPLEERVYCVRPLLDLSLDEAHDKLFYEAHAS